jgi:hypothetical protein
MFEFLAANARALWIIYRLFVSFTVNTVFDGAKLKF